MKYRILLSFLLLIAQVLQAQEIGFIKGKLVDSETGEPVPFATIKLKNKMVGVISNTDGDFQLPNKLKSLAEAIEISCIGYFTKSISLDELLPNQLNVIKMQLSTRQLGEVVINAKKQKGLAAHRIVELAIENIPINFPFKPFSYVAYYRDYQFKDKESEYVNLNEAIVEIADKGFDFNDQLTTQLKLYEYKRNTDFRSDPASEISYDNKSADLGREKNKFIPNATLFPWGGNELSILRLHDAIRNYKIYSYSFINTLSEDFVNNHFFKREESVFLDKVLLYCISFETKPSVSSSLNFAKGKIYIEKDNYSIHKIEYACYTKTMRETQLMYDIQLEYARKDSLMYLNYISFNNFFQTRNESDFRMIDVTLDRGLNGFVINFNNVPEKTSVLNKSNYEFKFSGRPLEIQRIVHEENEKQVIVVLSKKEETKFLRDAAEISVKLESNIKNIRDVDNRELDKVTLNSVHQFRELFVQRVDIGEPIDFNSRFIKDIPLSKNVPESIGRSDSDYWMNSPLKKTESSIK